MPQNSGLPASRDDCALALDSLLVNGLINGQSPLDTPDRSLVIAIIASALGEFDAEDRKGVDSRQPLF